MKEFSLPRPFCHTSGPMTDEFIAAYPTTTNAELGARYGVSTVTILKWARRLGLRKTREHWSQAQRQRMLGRARRYANHHHGRKQPTR